MTRRFADFNEAELDVLVSGVANFTKEIANSREPYTGLVHELIGEISKRNNQRDLVAQRERIRHERDAYRAAYRELARNPGNSVQVARSLRQKGLEDDMDGATGEGRR